MPTIYLCFKNIPVCSTGRLPAINPSFKQARNVKKATRILVLDITVAGNDGLFYSESKSISIAIAATSYRRVSTDEGAQTERATRIADKFYARE